MKIPTEKDWENWNLNEDTRYSHCRFAGKSNKEVQSYFRLNVIEAVDELRWMPKVPFQYYMTGFKDFVESKRYDENDAPNIASCFIELVLEKIENSPEVIEPIIHDLLPTLEYLATHQAEYDADREIYGNFQIKMNQIKGILRKMSD